MLAPQPKRHPVAVCGIGTKLDPQPLVDAILKRAEELALAVALGDDEGHPRSRITLSLLTSDDTSRARQGSVVHILSTGTIGRIDFDGDYSFVRAINSGDEEDVNENADDFTGLAAAYLRGDGEIVKVRGWLGGSHEALVIRLGEFQYEIGPRFTNVREV